MFRELLKSTILPAWGVVIIHHNIAFPKEMSECINTSCHVDSQVPPIKKTPSFFAGKRPHRAQTQKYQGLKTAQGGGNQSSPFVRFRMKHCLVNGRVVKKWFTITITTPIKTKEGSYILDKSSNQGKQVTIFSQELFQEVHLQNCKQKHVANNNRFVQDVRCEFTYFNYFFQWQHPCCVLSKHPRSYDKFHRVDWLYSYPLVLIYYRQMGHLKNTPQKANIEFFKMKAWKDNCPFHVELSFRDSKLFFVGMQL